MRLARIEIDLSLGAAIVHVEQVELLRVAAAVGLLVVKGSNWRIFSFDCTHRFISEFQDARDGKLVW
ncbi:unnamed protein product, partial [Amoebophrya sp. A25]|eukprot:GSA25T00011518001.1